MADETRLVTKPLGVALMVASSVLACGGQLLWKLAADGGLLKVVAGFALYALGALVMLIAYRHGELSVLQPILGLSYVLSLLLGAVWLGEAVSWGRIIGVTLVVVGVALIAGGRREVGRSEAPT